MKRNIIYTILDTTKDQIWSLEEVKNYLRISHNYDDLLISSLIEVATENAESFTGISLYRRVIECTIRKVPENIKLKYIPIIEVKSGKIVEDNNKLDITENFSEIDSFNQTIYFKEKYIGRQIELNYICGQIKPIAKAIGQGILMHIAAMYDHTENGSKLSNEIKDLYLPYRNLKI